MIPEKQTAVQLVGPDELILNTFISRDRIRYWERLNPLAFASLI